MTPSIISGLRKAAKKMLAGWNFSSVARLPDRLLNQFWLISRIFISKRMRFHVSSFELELCTLWFTAMASQELKPCIIWRLISWKQGFYRVQKINKFLCHQKDGVRVGNFSISDELFELFVYNFTIFYGLDFWPFLSEFFLSLWG